MIARHSLPSILSAKRTANRRTLAVTLSLLAHGAVLICLVNAAVQVSPLLNGAEEPRAINAQRLVLTAPPPKPVEPTPTPQASARPFDLHTPALGDASLGAPVVLPMDPTPARGEDTGPVRQIAQPRAPVITDPHWLRTPDAAQVNRVYPDRAQRVGVGGLATLSCLVTAAGTVESCSVLAETPSDMGFGAAALSLAPYFRLQPRMEDGAAVGGARVVIPIRFKIAAGEAG